MEQTVFETAYRLISELLLHPDFRDGDIIAKYLLRLEWVPTAIKRPIRAFLGHAASGVSDEYVSTIELSAPCPLYLGSYLFDEPNTCRGAGMSGRNRYMIELQNLYRHFGFEMAGKELPDYVPMATDFLWVSMHAQHKDTIGLRRLFLEKYVQPALAPLQAKLIEFESPYAHLIEALGFTIELDLEEMTDSTRWTPPPDEAQRGSPFAGQQISPRVVAEEVQP